MLSLDTVLADGLGDGDLLDWDFDPFKSSDVGGFFLVGLDKLSSAAY